VMKTDKNKKEADRPTNSSTALKNTEFQKYVMPWKKKRKPDKAPTKPSVKPVMSILDALHLLESVRNILVS